MRTKMRATCQRDGFTLLELLLVVAILAIVAGGLIVAYDGLETKAARGTAAHSMASLDQAVRTYTAVTRTAPNRLDALVATTATNPTAAGELLASLSANEVLDEKKLIATPLTTVQAGTLRTAGITTLRYIDKSQNKTDSDDTTNILLADVPNRVFDDPVSGTNRGRGFAGSVVAGAFVAVWNPGLDPVGRNNAKLGAAANDVLIVFGLGNNATIVGNDGDSVEPRERASPAGVTLSTAPTYGNARKNEYSRYLLVYNVGSNTNPRSVAKLQAVLDSNGDSLDEELAAYSGQRR